VNARDLQFDLKNSRRTAKLLLATRLESSKDKNVKTSSLPISVPEDQFQTALTRGIPLTSTLAGTAGDPVTNRGSGSDHRVCWRALAASFTVN